MILATHRDMLMEMIQGLYNAESQLIKALPRVALRAQSNELRTALEHHLVETRSHAQRLEDIACSLHVRFAGKVCFAMAGLLKEGEYAMSFGGDPELVDAAIIKACQAVEHYEIAEYTALRAHADLLGLADIVALINQTLREEQGALETLASFTPSENRATRTS